MNDDPIAPDFEAFLTKTFQPSSDANTLALGEHHQTIEHWEWLQQHLDTLIKDHGILTIGIESPSFLNVLFWAYQDGTLEAKLGSKEHAQHYLRAILLSTTPQAFHDSMNAEADFLIAAMDAGLRVAAYDSRDTWQGWKQSWHESRKEFAQGMQAAMGVRSTPDQAIMYHQLRSNAAFLEAISHGEPGKCVSWCLGEIEWLRRLQPRYESKFQSIEKLALLGNQKISESKLTFDALSAVLFDALAMPDGNRITIGGASHIDGIGDDEKNTKGIFGHHLFSVSHASQPQSKHKVTQAMIATTVIGDMFKKRAAAASPFKEHEFALLDSKENTVELLRGDSKGQPFIKLFSPDAMLPRDVARRLKPNERASFSRSHINPLLMPDIKTAADTVRAVMYPEERGRPR